MKNSVTYYQTQTAFRVFVENAFPTLVKYKEVGDKSLFDELLLKILPDIRNYINERLASAIAKGHFPRGKYKADDFINQLFIEVYDHLDEVEHEKAFYAWLFKKTNELLDTTITDEEFDEVFFKNIDDYSKAEWDEMAEKYSVDADGDLLMIEELDDLSYNHNDYTLKDVFIEDTEKELIEKIDRTLSEEAIAQHIKMVLHNLPIAMRDSFNLYANKQFALEDIAKIKATTANEIEKLINDTRKVLRTSFFNRCLVN